MRVGLKGFPKTADRCRSWINQRGGLILLGREHSGPIGHPAMRHRRTIVDDEHPSTATGIVDSINRAWGGSHTETNQKSLHDLLMRNIAVGKDHETDSIGRDHRFQLFLRHD